MSYVDDDDDDDDRDAAAAAKPLRAGLLINSDLSRL